MFEELISQLEDDEVEDDEWMDDEGESDDIPSPASAEHIMTQACFISHQSLLNLLKRYRTNNHVVVTAHCQCI